MAAKVKYNPDYHDNWAWSLAAMGATNEEIAKAMGVSDAKVIRSLYQRAVGYEYEEEKKIIEYDKDGNVKPIKIEKTKKQVPPDVGAQCFWLKNRQRDKWQDRPEVIPDTGADDGDQVQFYLPDNGRDG